jgi:hypothetical protein
LRAWGALWFLYVQLGLALLKGIFVRSRLRLPSRRAQDFQRFRAAWLRYHLDVLDGVRLVTGAAFAIAGLSRMLAQGAPLLGGVAMVVSAGGGALALALWGARQRRHLREVEREVDLVSLSREIRPFTGPQQGFAARGLLFFDRDNPGVLARGPRGIAINLGNAHTYYWAGYLLGLVLLAFSFPLLGSLRG